MIETLPVRKVTVDQSAQWLVAGWNDFMRDPKVGLAYGALFTVAGYILFFGLMQIGMESLILPLAGGFLLVAPFFAVGLYDVSRRHEAGEKVSVSDALHALPANIGQTGNMGVVLLLIYMAWVEVALLIFALFYTGPVPGMDRFISGILDSPQVIPFLAVGTLAGGILAAVAFTVSAVSLPLLMERDVNVVTAIATSIEAVRQNWQVMLGWALMIALITFTGMALFFVGVAIALPLAAHATWHAYRALVV